MRRICIILLILIIFIINISSFKFKLNLKSSLCQISSSFQIACAKNAKNQNNENDDNLGSNIHLPILQLFLPPGELVGEFICGTEIKNGNEELLQRKISSAIKMNFQTSSSSSSSSSLSTIATPTISKSNIYSTEQITNYISNHKCALLLTRQGCKQCEYFERNIFNDDFLNEIRISQENAFDFNILDVQTEYVQDYIEELSFRLTGKTKVSSSIGSSNDVVEDCLECNNTGFIKCNACSATGMVAKGSYTTICTTCTGFKKVRCPSCGGKCIKCDI